MAAPKKLPSTPLLVLMAENGYTHQQIADEFDVSRQAVSLQLRGVKVRKPEMIKCPQCKGRGKVPKSHHEE